MSPALGCDVNRRAARQPLLGVEGVRVNIDRCDGLRRRYVGDQVPWLVMVTGTLGTIAPVGSAAESLWAAGAMISAGKLSLTNYAPKRNYA